MEAAITIGATSAILPLLRATPLMSQFGSKEGLETEQTVVDDLRGRMGIKKNIQVRLTPIGGFFPFSAFGALALPFEQSFTVPEIESDIWKRVRKESRTFIYAHEISHLENNDILKMTAVLVITWVAVMILFSSVMPIHAALLISQAVAMVAMAIFSKHIEKKADLRACEILTDNEKGYGVEFFEGIKQSQLEARGDARKGNSLRDIFTRNIIDSKGNNLLDFFHPPLTERISYIRNTIKDKSVSAKLDRQFSTSVAGA